MIRIDQIKMDIHHSEDDLESKLIKLLRIKKEDLISYTIRKQSIDARKKPKLYYVYTVDVSVKKERALLKKLKNSHIKYIEKTVKYEPQITGEIPIDHRPIVVGTGPAGLFCAYQLAKYGYRPILLERGMNVEERTKDVEAFWNTGKLKTESNVQFGEGGAGTFSDGKLNTLVNDPVGRNMKVLQMFVENGASEEILYQSKPHIGTDVLYKVVKNMRFYIESKGGEYYFHTKVTDLLYDHTQNMTGVKTTDTLTGEEKIFRSHTVVLAIGHSARDTFTYLKNTPVEMSQKSFAVGVRAEHPQTMINQSQYGEGHDQDLPAAAYKLTAKTVSGRGVYTFCMCPGGYVVNASSEEGRMAVNGMSYHARDGINANSAVIVTVTPDDFGSDDVLAGMDFQRTLEERAYAAGEGNIPVQRFVDFKNNIPSSCVGAIKPQMKGAYRPGDVRAVFPEPIAEALIEGIEAFDHKIHGYASDDTILSAVESRTSSPVRIVRDDLLQSNIRGLYPCGEGAGYAGGITSAAMDGLKVSEQIFSKYRP